MNYIKYFCLISTRSIWAMVFLNKNNQIKISLKTNNKDNFQRPHNLNLMLYINKIDSIKFRLILVKISRI